MYYNGTDIMKMYYIQIRHETNKNIFGIYN